MGQIQDIMHEIELRKEKNERVMIVTLTIKMAEDLTAYLKERGVKVTYLHNETKTLERTEIIYQLRKGKYDVLVGINLLREGLDIPEVSLICILDADKEGFLRSQTSLIQTIGRAARNVDGEVILYADNITDSVRNAVNITERRRKIQIAYNKDHNITPRSVVRKLKEKKIESKVDDIQEIDNITIEEVDMLIEELEIEMKEAAQKLDFERAAKLRDRIMELKEE
jgi:excinuclease ABC subunit B